MPEYLGNSHLLALAGSSYARTAVPKFHQKPASVVQSVTVGKSGSRNFTTVQEAIDWVPANNKQWVRIHVKPGTYKEKVTVPKDKQFIYLEGEGEGRALIEWDDHGGADNSSTFTLWADNFLASHITIKNTHDLGPGGAHTVDVAPAILIWGDKAAFYGCRFYGVQDTLSDLTGRHFFQSCYIEGAVDFIWGYGQSLYEGCNIISTAANLGAGGLTGFVTAQGRERASDTSAFVFKGGSVNGKGLTYLGRAYRAYSTVIFYETYFGSVIVSLGWDAWHQSKQVDKITFVESNCKGPGSSMSGRVNWIDKLSTAQLDKYLDRAKFIDQDGWIGAQPTHN
ncbi:hypothetical protein CDL15_Pgr021271 [Punica granatum]|uniref:Pectinesterase n=1 Tax=Punica granatum TaxID=22663 RepID=A0A218WRD0_PUNGR|nr:hypothetical protein CDL15_Pgr021271 [Punica granatum]